MKMFHNHRVTTFVHVAIFIHQFVFSSGQICPYGWVESPESDRCYKFDTTLSKTWNDARDSCRYQGGNLISFRNAQERDYIWNQVKKFGQNSQLPDSYWTGLNSIKDPKVWEWSDGTLFDNDTVPWQSGEPNSETENCGEFHPYGMNDHDCSRKFNFICSRDKNKPFFCPNDWYHLGEYCYHLIDDQKQFWEAREDCANFDGELTSIQNIADQTTAFDIAKTFENEPAWIGLYTKSNGGGSPGYDWLWTDGTKFNNTITYWIDGQPNVEPGKEDNTCVIVNPNTDLEKSWSAQQCDRERKYICRRIVGRCAGGWLEKNGKCYKFYVQEKKSWFGARDHCARMNTNLLSIQNQYEQDYINIKAKQLARSHINTMWLGVSDKSVTDETLIWSDGTAVEGEEKFKNWNLGQPNTVVGKRDCGRIFTGLTEAYWSMTTYCLQLSAYACETTVGSVPIVPTTAPVPYACPNDWTMDNSFCYSFEEERVTWPMARLKCQNLAVGADLVTIMSETEQTFINSKLQAISWIGFNDRAVEGSWVWNDGINPIFTNWGDGEPNNGVADGENCAEVVDVERIKGKWNDVACSNKLPFICKMDAAIVGITTPTGTPGPRWTQKCGPYWEDDVLSEYCYQFITTASSWTDSRATCQDHGGDLLSINSVHEQRYIAARTVGITGSLGMWIGIHDRSEKFIWEWSSGDPVNFFNWAPGEPNNWAGTEDCGEMALFSKQWNDISCNARRYSICKKRGTVSTTLPAPTTPVIGNGDLTYETEPKLEYTFLPFSLTGRTSLSFLIKASGGAHILLAEISGDLDDSASHQIELGIENNQYSEIRSRHGTTHHVRVETPGILNKNEYRAFWIGWNGANIQVGRGKTIGQDVFMKWQAPEDFKASYTAISTEEGIPGKWIFVNIMGYRYGCEEGWVQYGEKCYHFVNDWSKSWQQARDECRYDRSELVSILDENEYNFVASKTKEMTSVSNRWPYDKVWIGLNDLRTAFHFEWLDGSPVTFTRWNAREPNDHNGNREQCVVMYKESHKARWNDVPCDTRSGGYICKKSIAEYPPTSVPPTVDGCPTDFQSAWDAYCYSLVTTPKTFTDADIHCTAKGGKLVDILSLPEQEYISSELAFISGNIWIGLTNRGANSTFYWTSGRPVTYTNWHESHTGNEVHSCVSARATSPIGKWMDDDCSNRRGFICKKGRLGYTPAPPPTTIVTPEPCPSEWKGFGDKCYKAYNEYQVGERKTWGEAESFCRSIGGDLASLHSEEVSVFLKDVTTWSNTGYWIGLSKRSTDNAYHWNDGSPFQYSNWDKPNEPNDHLGHENCAELISNNNHKWRLSYCYISRNWICELQRGIQPLTTPAAPTPNPAHYCANGADWRYWSGHCYFASESYEKKSWFAARKYCMDHGGDLTSINSIDENHFLTAWTGKTSNDKLWIGLNELELDGYKWSDGSPTSLVIWAEGEPNDYNFGQRCVDLYAFNGFWNDDNCGDPLGFICKSRNESIDARTLPPTVEVPGYCPQGYNGVGNKCFGLFGEDIADRLSWTDAVETCRRNGLAYDLATINSNLESSVITAMLKGRSTDLWIGLNERIIHGDWRWANNEDVVYTNWGQGEPNSGWNEKHCANVKVDPGWKGKWDDFNCDEPKGYVCQVYKDLSNPIITAPVTPPNSCLDGYSPYTDGCYKLVLTSMQWSAASSNCQLDGASLVSIHSAFENAFIHAMLSSPTIVEPVWIGLSDQVSKGNYRWSDQWPVRYTNWGNNEPSKGPGEGCVVRNPDGTWNDTLCTGIHPFICKTTSAIPPPTQPFIPGTCPSDDWITGTSACYYIYTGDKKESWTLADLECMVKGGKLASIADLEENQFIMDQIQIQKPGARGGLWIGLLQRAGGGFFWNDGKPVSYVNWQNGEPSDKEGSNENCVEMYSESGTWNDHMCNEGRWYICKADKQTPATLPSRSTTRQLTTSLTPPTTTVMTTSAKNTFTLPPTPGTTRIFTLPPWLQTTPLNGIRTTRRAFTLPAGGSTTIRQSNTAQPNTGKKPLSGGAIAGIVIGVIAALALLVVAAFFIRKKRQLSVLHREISKNMNMNNPLYSNSQGIDLSSPAPVNNFGYINDTATNA
ncbi:unnamed protein product [Owenia fusiformis]|uniref:C-type lectin domain-containing protein n=1 Tax=Owenia fusiformis TaxID=6347 RepID=A0A8S4MZU0_OWEFU|nr:unnamed protein product [Owenia fusiformis]